MISHTTNNRLCCRLVPKSLPASVPTLECATWEEPVPLHPIKDPVPTLLAIHVPVPTELPQLARRLKQARFDAKHGIKESPRLRSTPALSVKVRIILGETGILALFPKVSEGFGR